MDLALYAVQAVLVEGRSVRDVAGATGRSKSWVQRHCTLYRSGGEAALVPRKRGPKAPPNQTPAVVEDAIVALRKELVELGLDAGARTIAYHLASANPDGSRDLDDPPDPGPARVRHRPAPQAPPLELAALRGRRCPTSAGRRT